MTVSVRPMFDFDTPTFSRDLPGMYEPWSAAAFPDPGLALFNEALAGELGIDVDQARTSDGVAQLIGSPVTAGDMTTIAQAYSGHQFGGFSPRLGDGRALLLGEIIDRQGRRRDVHLKGSGRTPFARGGDGKAAIGPMLREYLIGEAMHALGIPTTRALAVLQTGEYIAREQMLPGAVLVRVASSHLRVGSFQYAAGAADESLLRRLADYAINRHYPTSATADHRYLAFFAAVVDAQAHLLAQWMTVGFIHGVMNTDNTTISGETIDYGPCAFMDAFDPATVFSSIDHGGRYAFGNQPNIAQWNLARLAETLLSLLDDDTEVAVQLATAALNDFVPAFQRYWRSGMRRKLGLTDDTPDVANDDRSTDAMLIDDVFAVLQAEHTDMTRFFRLLSSAARGDVGPVSALFNDTSVFDAWHERWWQAIGARPDLQRAAAMDAANPIYIPRNHLVEEALAAATIDGDLAPCRTLLDVLSQPFVERDGFERFTLGAPPAFGRYQTFCGT